MAAPRRVVPFVLALFLVLPATMPTAMAVSRDDEIYMEVDMSGLPRGDVKRVERIEFKTEFEFTPRGEPSEKAERSAVKKTDKVKPLVQLCYADAKPRPSIKDVIVPDWSKKQSGCQKVKVFQLSKNLCSLACKAKMACKSCDVAKLDSGTKKWGFAVPASAKDGDYIVVNVEHGDTAESLLLNVKGDARGGSRFSSPKEWYATVLAKLAKDEALRAFS